MISSNMWYGSWPLLISHFRNCIYIATQAVTDLKTPKSGSEDALKYVSEVFRALEKGGLFAVITAMPPTVFRTIAVDPLHAQAQGRNGSKNVQTVLTNWKNCIKKKIRTNEGGIVYFYIIQKMTDFDEEILTGIPDTRDNPSRLHTAKSAAEKGKLQYFMICFSVLNSHSFYYWCIIIIECV